MTNPRDPADAWALQAAITARYVDDLGRGMDDGIIETVTALRLLGFTTTASCEGHLDRGSPGPWVHVVARKSTRHRLGELLGGFGRFGHFGHFGHFGDDHDLTVTPVYGSARTRIVAYRLWNRSVRDIGEADDRSAVLNSSRTVLGAFTSYLRRCADLGWS